MHFQSYRRALNYLYTHIPHGRTLKFPGELGLRRARAIMKVLGNPQEKLKVVHVAGTSGKGSTAYLTSRLLEAHGFKVGLHLSPHLLDLRERFQVNNKIISKAKFVRYFQELISRLARFNRAKWGKPTYFELLVALAFYIFEREKVDYTVMETGLGGLYDATNVVENPNKIVLLTKFGLDHTRLLGKTLIAIARQKGGVIRPHNLVISGNKQRVCQEALHKIAKQNSTNILYVKSNVNFRILETDRTGSLFNFQLADYQLTNIKLSLLGPHQVENGALALGCLAKLGKRDGFLLSRPKIRQALSVAHFPGRLEIKKIGPLEIITDGAHNPQKIRSLLLSLKLLYPKQRFVFCVAFKKGKDYRTMLKAILPFATKIYLSRFFVYNQDLVHLSESPHVLAQYLKRLGFRNYESVVELRHDLAEIVQHVTAPIVITGSLYFLGEVYTQLGFGRN